MHSELVVLLEDQLINCKATEDDSVVVGAVSVEDAIDG